MKNYNLSNNILSHSKSAYHIKKFIFNLLFLLLFLRIITGYSTKNNIQKPDNLITKKIQKSIDSCFAIGGGIVKLQKGIHISGSLILKSNVKLFLEKGAILQGSSDDRDYQNDVFIYAKDAQNIAVEGEGIIDWVDCYNPNGEEKSRGPHCIKFINFKSLIIRGIQIINSANWAINCRYCNSGILENVSVKGGHHALHIKISRFLIATFVLVMMLSLETIIRILKLKIVK